MFVTTRFQTSLITYPGTRGSETYLKIESILMNVIRQNILTQDTLITRNKYQLFTSKHAYHLTNKYVKESCNIHMHAHTCVHTCTYVYMCTNICAQIQLLCAAIYKQSSMCVLLRCYLRLQKL